MFLHPGFMVLVYKNGGSGLEGVHELDRKSCKRTGSALCRGQAASRDLAAATLTSISLASRCVEAYSSYAQIFVLSRWLLRLKLRPNRTISG
jgi:hypothetical protein